MLRTVIPLRAASCSIVRSSSPIEGHNIAESCASKQRDIKWCNVVAVPIVDEHAAPRPDRAFPRHGQGTLPTGRGACPAGRAPVSTGRALFTPSRSTLPPGPHMPMLLQSALTWNRTIAFFTANQRKYGSGFTIRSLPWGTAVIVNDTQLVRQIFTGDPAVYHAGEGNSLLAPVLGERSVLVLDEDQHLQARKRLLPPFHGDSVRRYGEIVERIVLKDIARWPTGSPFPLRPRMQAITLEVILQAVIGVTDPVRLRALRETLPAAALPDPTLMAMWVVAPLEHVGRWRRFRRIVERANRLLREEIAARRTDPDLEQREDVLSQLVRAGETDDEELRDQIMTLLIAGHETTTTGLAWTFERLLRTPEALARAREGAGVAAHPSRDPRRVAPAEGPDRAWRLAAACRSDADPGDHAHAPRPCAVPRAQALSS